MRTCADLGRLVSAHGAKMRPVPGDSRRPRVSVPARVVVPLEETESPEPSEPSDGRRAEAFSPAVLNDSGVGGDRKTTRLSCARFGSSGEFLEVSFVVK